MTELDRSERFGAEIRAAAAQVRAPATLRATVLEQAEPRPRRRRLVARLAVAGALAVAVAIAALTAGAPPTVEDVASAALQPPQRAAPPHAADDERFIDAQIGRVRFPYWEDNWGWRAVGARTDEVAGREALTVVYRKGKRGVHYTVVAGEPLKIPKDAPRTDVDGTEVATLRRAGADIVVWRRNGHTCILASRMADAKELRHFVAW